MAQVNNPEGINQYTGNRRSIRQTVGFAVRAVKNEFSADPGNVGKIVFGAGGTAAWLHHMAKKDVKGDDLYHKYTQEELATSKRHLKLVSKHLSPQQQKEARGYARQSIRHDQRLVKRAAAQLALSQKIVTRTAKLARFAPPLMIAGGLIEIAARSKHVQAELEHIMGDVRQVSGVKAKTGALFHHMFNHVKRK